jgi:hypothetical protein
MAPYQADGSINGENSYLKDFLKRESLTEWGDEMATKVILPVVAAFGLFLTLFAIWRVRIHYKKKETAKDADERRIEALRRK